jgi:heptosyltransferase-1
MGDVLHLAPALTDLRKHYPDVVVDWMVEGSFAEIPRWHPSVDRVVKVSTRKWRKLSKDNISEFLAFWKELRKEPYDVIIDAQGLMKSAVFSRFAKRATGGVRVGFSGDSIKESPAAKLYSKKIAVDRELHAVDRLRALIAGSFNYPVPQSGLDYGLRLKKPSSSDNNTIMLFHGTTWDSKHLPNQSWRDIAELAGDDGYKVKLAWGNEQERERAEWIAQDLRHVSVLPRSNLTDLAEIITGIAGAIAVDTGLGHMAAAFGVPCVSVYGATDASLTGAVGQNQIHIQSKQSCSPCLLKSCPKLTSEIVDPPCYSARNGNTKVSADAIWQTLYEQIV